MLAARLVGRLGPDRAVGLALLTLAFGLVLFTSGFGIYSMAIIGGCIWSAGTFSCNSLQQSRLVGLAPPLASATVALNTSAVYLGQAVGSAGGGLVIARGVSATFGVVALGFVALALVTSLIAARLSRT
jgi:predicted MFS family arabinose efflux permease